MAASHDADVASFSLIGTSLDTTGPLSYYFDLIKQRDGLIFYHGASTGLGPYWSLIGSASYYMLAHYNGSSTVSVTASNATTYGDHVQLLAVRNADGSIQLTQALNGSAAVATSTSAANTTTSMTASLTISDAGTFGSAWDTRKAIKCTTGVQSFTLMSSSSSRFCEN